MAQPDPQHVTLDGSSLRLEDLARLARDPGARVAIAPEAEERVRHGARQIRRIADAYRKAFDTWSAALTAGGASGAEAEIPDLPPLLQDYGVTTGFGEFKDKPIHPDDLVALQENLLLSHAVGAGENADPFDPAGYFPAEVVRAALVVRLNTFLHGCSGVTWELVERVQAMIHRGIVPLIPLKGSLGSSGDLCPLAHLFVVLVGGGRYARVVRAGDLTGTLRRELALAEEAGEVPWDRPDAETRQRRREQLARDLGLETEARERGLPLDAVLWSPSPKEGLALTNGATFSAAMLALAAHDAASLADAADAAAALALEAVCGCARAFDPKIHDARGFPGQRDSAANLRALLAGSRLIERAPAVQDVYSLRCAPAVHGASRDALAFARAAAAREINAATDNPLFFPGEGDALHRTPPWDGDFAANWRHRPPPFGAERYDGVTRASYSAGNFHGQPVAMAADFLSIALAELADISERRTQMLLDEDHNRGLPADLIADAGVHSGYMLAQYTAAALVSENKVLAHPAAADSIPTSANSEDHVAMAAGAARKLRTVLANAQAVLAIELMVAAQALEWRVWLLEEPEAARVRPGGGGASRLEAFGAQMETWRAGREQARAFAARTAPGEQARIVRDYLAPGTGGAYRAIRCLASPMTEDRPLEGDIRRLRGAIEDGSLVAAVADALSAVGRSLRPPTRLAGLEPPP